MNTNDLVSGDNMNEMENLVVKSTSELQGIGGDIVDDVMGVEVEVVSEIMWYVLGDGTNEYKYEIINYSVVMEDDTQYNNGDREVVNDMDLGEDGAARRSFLRTCLRVRAIDYDEYSVDEIVEDMKTKSEVVEEEYFEEDDNPLKRADKCP